MFTALNLGGYSHKIRIPAFAAGVRAHGGTVIDVPVPTADKVLAAIAEHAPRFAFTSGCTIREAGARGVLRMRSIPLFVVDLGYFKRATGPKDENGFNQAGIDRLCWVPWRLDGPDTSGTWRARFDALDIPVAESIDPESRPKALLVLGQKPGDAQHGMDAAAVEAWLTEKAAEHLARGWQILFRPHPECERMVLHLPHTRLPSTAPLELHLARAREVLTINSTAGLHAIMHGLPVRCHAQAHYFAVAAGAGRARVLEHCRALAWAQWTCAEMRDGLALEFLAQYLPPAAVTTASAA